MKSVVWHGKRGARVGTVPDLNLPEVLAPYMSEGDILGHELMGIVKEFGSAVTAIKFSVDAGYTEVAPTQNGPNQEGFCKNLTEELGTTLRKL